LIPVIDFIVCFIDLNDSAYQVVIDAGFLDMLLRIYTVFPAFERGTSALSTKCTSALVKLSRQPDCLEAIIQHPICTLWTKCNQLFRDQLPNVVDDSIQIRCSSWRRTQRFCVMSRLVTTYKLLSTSRLKDAMATDMCIDLVEFSR
jgi:hypothetical protein